MKRKYAHVIVVGIDGAGSFIKDADMPNFQRIFSDGAVTYQALSSQPTISAECWGSMLLGVGPEIHKLTNEILESTPYPIDSDHTVTGIRLLTESSKTTLMFPTIRHVTQSSHRLYVIISARKNLIFCLSSSTVLTVQVTEAVTASLNFTNVCTR